MYLNEIRPLFVTSLQCLIRSLAESRIADECAGAIRVIRRRSCDSFYADAENSTGFAPSKLREMRIFQGREIHATFLNVKLNV